MKMIAKWSRRIEVAIFVHMYWNIQYIGILIEGLLDAVAWWKLTRENSVRQQHTHTVMNIPKMVYLSAMRFGLANLFVPI